MQKRLAEIDAEIARATGWGAKLTVLLEERRAILRNLGYVAATSDGQHIICNSLISLVSPY